MSNIEKSKFPRRYLLQVYQVIQSLLQPQVDSRDEEHPSPLPIRWAHCLVKNRRRLLLEEIEPMTIRIDTAGFPLEYGKARTELIRKAAVKDEKGEPVTKPGLVPGQIQYIIADGAALQHSIEELDKQFREQLEETKRFLDEEVEFEFYRIPLEQFPLEIAGPIMEALLPLVQEDNPAR